MKQNTKILEKRLKQNPIEPDPSGTESPTFKETLFNEPESKMSAMVIELILKPDNIRLQNDNNLTPSMDQLQPHSMMTHV